VDVDLFLPDAPYVIGEADRDAGAAIFSLSRLSHAEADKVRHRIQVETVHAAGHLLGLSHCSDFRCAMFLSRDAADADRKAAGLCGSCRAALGLNPR
jgi:archaemetzincin